MNTNLGIQEDITSIQLNSESVRKLIAILREWKTELNITAPFVIGSFISGTTLNIYTTDLKTLFDNIEVMNRYYVKIKSIEGFSNITDLHFDKILPVIV